MQSLVNPGEAKQIEQDYAHTTLASSEMVAATAQATAEAIQAFIQSLRERLRAAQPSAQDPESEAQAPQSDDLMDDPPALSEPIEIKMGREIVYREGYAHKDPVNKLNANTLKLLRAAVDAPQPAGAEATTEVKGTINIKAGDELVYRMSKGAVETNHFAPIPESPVEEVDLTVAQEAPTVETDQPSLTDAPSPTVVQDEIAQESSTAEESVLSDEPEPVMPEPMSAEEVMPDTDVTPPILATEPSQSMDEASEVPQPASETVSAVPLASTPATSEPAPQILDEATAEVVEPEPSSVSPQADEVSSAVAQESSTAEESVLSAESELMPEPVSAEEVMPDADVAPPILATEPSQSMDEASEVPQPASETASAVPLDTTPATPEPAPPILAEATAEVVEPDEPSSVSPQSEEVAPAVAQESSTTEELVLSAESELMPEPVSAEEAMPDADIAPSILATEPSQSVDEASEAAPAAHEPVSAVSTDATPAISEAAPPILDEAAADGAEPPLSVSSPKPTRGSAQPLAMAAPKVISILDVLERQAQPVADPKTRQWVKHTTQMMRRSSQQLTERVVALAANIRSRQVASTAVDLLQAYGTTYRPGRGFYVAENYVIKAKGRMVTVSDREGVELMAARKTRWGLDILKNDMVASQEADFMKARQQIQIQGVEGLSPDPPMRVRQLGNLAPAGDRGITRDLTALALAKTARKLLEVTGSRPNVQGKRVFQGGSQYRIEETPNSLKIQAGERGQILSIDNGKIKTDLTSKDVAYFRFIDRELSQDLQLHAAAKVTPLTRQTRPAMAMGE